MLAVERGVRSAVFRRTRRSRCGRGTLLRGLRDRGASRSGSAWLVAQHLAQLRVRMLAQVGTNVSRCGRVLSVPEQRLAERFDSFGIGGVRLKQSAALRPGLGVVGENAAQRHLVTGVRRKFLHQHAQARHRVRTPVFGRGLCFVVGQGLIAGGWLIAIKLAVNSHRLRVLALLRKMSGLLQLHVRCGLRAGLLRACDAGVVGIDRAQAVKIATGEFGVAAHLGRARKSAERLGIVRV